MSDRNKGKAKKRLAWLSVMPFIILTYCSAGQPFSTIKFHISLTADTLPPVGTVIFNSDTTPEPTRLKPIQMPGIKRTVGPVKTDTIIRPSIDTFDFRTSKDSLSAPVAYHADDSMILDVPAKKLLLYGKISSIKYLDNQLTAPLIEYDQSTNLVRAFLRKDSAGKVISFPTFNQGDFKSVSDTIEFNMQSGKGLTKGTYTQQGEMYVYGEKIKKADKDIFYALNARFTTCNLDTPHFAFVSHKIKFITQKMAFSGPVHPEFEGVPLPVYLPFGIYPLSQGRHSGLIAPSFTANDQLGLALDGLGYYKILSPNWDVITRGTLYSYGGWSANINPRYYRRYRYQGNLALDIQKYKPLDQPSSRTLNIRWGHNADSKARPGVNFSANVNAGSSKYNEQVPNDPRRNFTNNLNSSITYAKVWKDKPYNISISANHNQNTTQRLINLNLPDIAFNVNTLYPFRRKEPIGDYNWYENIGVALNTNARSLSSFYDTAGRIGKQLADNLQWGANHNIPITLSLPELGPVQIGPSVTYQERWYQQQFIRKWNPLTKKIDTTINKGFYTERDMSFGIGASTRIFGMFTFNKKNKVQAIRHEIRPSVSLSYKPDFTRGVYYTTQVDTAGNQARFSIYERSIYGAFGEGRFAGLNFSLDNNISMKVRNKKDTGEASLKKVSLIDGLRLDGNYNFMLDSFKLSPLTVSARSNLFEKVNITANATFDPYQTDSRGERIDKLIWTQRPLSLGTLTSGAVSLQSQFTGGDKKPGAAPNVNTPQNVDASGMALTDYQQDAAYIRNNPGEFVDFSIPWSIDFSYSLRFNRERKPDYSGYLTRLFQDVTWNSSVNLTEKWKIGVNGYYNITTKEIGSLSMYLSREMHCWQMAINISPVGRFRFFSINISPKSPILRDLKINRTRSFIDL